MNATCKLAALLALSAGVALADAGTSMSRLAAPSSVTAPRSAINPQPLPPRHGEAPAVRALRCGPDSARICIGGVCHCE